MGSRQATQLIALEWWKTRCSVTRCRRADAARAAGCHELQGYYYARPLAAQEAADWLKRAFSLRASGLMAR